MRSVQRAPACHSCPSRAGQAQPVRPALARRTMSKSNTHCHGAAGQSRQAMLHVESLNEGTCCCCCKDSQRSRLLPRHVIDAIKNVSAASCARCSRPDRFQFLADGSNSAPAQQQHRLQQCHSSETEKPPRFRHQPASSDADCPPSPVPLPPSKQERVPDSFSLPTSCVR
jgi:hypothetical protein